MANISSEIAAIQAASTGAAVRQPIVDALTKINSGVLPSVTSADAGKVMKVDANGEWVLGTGGGGSVADIVAWLNDVGQPPATIVPFFTSETNPTGYVLTYSSQASSSTPAWALFNKTIEPVATGSTSNARWTTNQSLPQWVQIALPSAKKINAFYIANIKTSTGALTSSPCKTYKIQGSNDNETFIDIYEETLEDALIGKYVALQQESDSYIFYRITVTDTYASGYAGLTSFFPMYIDA